MASPFSDKVNKYNQKIKEWRKISYLQHRSYFQSNASLGQKKHGGFNSEARHIHIRMHR